MLCWRSKTGVFSSIMASIFYVSPGLRGSTSLGNATITAHQRHARRHSDKANAPTLKLSPPNAEVRPAAHFHDFVHASLLPQLPQPEMNDHAHRIYPPLHPELQRAAAPAVESGLQLVA